MNHLEETVDPKDYPTLNSKNMICLQTDKDITPVLRDIMKLAKKVRSVDLLKVLNYNDTTTSLVEVPCSAKKSGFKKQARRSWWVHQILQCVQKYKEEELVTDDERQQEEDDNKFAYTDDDAARWLITYLGKCYPCEFVKSAHALDMPIHQGKMDSLYTTAMRSDAGVSLAVQQTTMKYLIGCCGYWPPPPLRPMDGTTNACSRGNWPCPDNTGTMKQRHLWTPICWPNWTKSRQQMANWRPGW